jgi:hypothetical protein
MTVTVETGAGIAGANTYITPDELRSFADARGTSLGSDDSTLEVYLIKAIDYLESMRDQFQGDKTDSDNPLQWPRSGVFIDGTEIDDDVIPTELKNAQAQLALESISVDLQPTVSAGNSGAVASKKVGDIEISYHDSDNRTQPSFTKFNSWIAPLCKIRGAVAVRT